MLPSLHQLLDAGYLGSTQWLYSAKEHKELTSLIERKLLSAQLNCMRFLLIDKNNYSILHEQMSCKFKALGALWMSRVTIVADSVIALILYELIQIGTHESNLSLFLICSLCMFLFAILCPPQKSIPFVLLIPSLHFMQQEIIVWNTLPFS